jgi:hypothetical protein
MKLKLYLLALGLAVSAVAAEQTAGTDEKFEVKTMRPVLETLVVETPDPQNRIESDGKTYSGIAVALVKADNKFQLLNPVAPGKYGTFEDSVARDPITGGASGLKLFSISF